jgi:hypothetical protein
LESYKNPINWFSNATSQSIDKKMYLRFERQNKLPNF